MHASTYHIPLTVLFVLSIDWSRHRGHLRFALTAWQAQLHGQKSNSEQRADADHQLQAQLLQEKTVLQRQLASFQQQFCDLCDHPAVAGLPQATACHKLPPSFTNIRIALDSVIASRGARHDEAAKCELVHAGELQRLAAVVDKERAEWQRQLHAAVSEARAASLENEELRRTVAQQLAAAQCCEERAATSNAAVKFFAEQLVTGREEVVVLQRQLHALSSEVQPAFARSAELKRAVAELQAALQHERARAAEAEARCKQLDDVCSQQKIELLSKMNSATAAASARLSARVTAIRLSEVMQQLRSD